VKDIITSPSRTERDIHPAVLILIAILGLFILRASLKNAAPLFTTASCSVEVSGSVHLSADLTIQYVAENLKCAKYDGAYAVFSVSTGAGLLLLFIAFYNSIEKIR
jgi:hypothetical protein